MCGIVGYIKLNNTIDDSHYCLIKQMMKTLNHRGPDDNGILNNQDIIFGHVRLNVIDLSSAGKQPFVSNQDHILCYNGEIYDFNILKKSLIKQKYHFKSKTDTEVLLYYLQEHTIDSIKNLKGMFSFAWHNNRTKKTYLARDHFGIKPLYYYIDKSGVFFASEIKALLNIPSYNPTVNKRCLEEYLAFRYVAPPNTLFSNIYQLEPGHYLEIDPQKKTLSKTKYFDIDDYASNSISLDINEAKEKLDFYLFNSVKSQIISDAPLGLQLSGGIDSCLLAKMLQKNNVHNPHSYTVTFDGLDQHISEWPYTKKTIKSFNLNSHQYSFSDAEIANAFYNSIWHLEEPLNHPHTPLIYLLCKKIKEKLTVVLTGEGSDELLLGYSRYLNFNQLQPLDSSRFLSNEFLARIFNISISEANDKSLESRLNIYKATSVEDPLKKLQVLDIKTYLYSLLKRQDKMSMAHGVESRVPYLDLEYVKFCLSIPLNFKINHGKSKYILKEIAKDIMGTEFAYRRKVGFHTPFKRWLRQSDDFNGMKNNLMNLDNIEYLFKDMRYIKSIVNDFLNTETNDYIYSDVAWIFLNLSMWHKQFIEGECREFRF